MGNDIKWCLRWQNPTRNNWPCGLNVFSEKLLNSFHVEGTCVTKSHFFREYFEMIWIISNNFVIFKKCCVRREEILIYMDDYWIFPTFQFHRKYIRNDKKWFKVCPKTWRCQNLSLFIPSNSTEFIKIGASKLHYSTWDFPSEKGFHFAISLCIIFTYPSSKRRLFTLANWTSWQNQSYKKKFGNISWNFLFSFPPTFTSSKVLFLL